MRLPRSQHRQPTWVTMIRASRAINADVPCLPCRVKQKHKMSRWPQARPATGRVGSGLNEGLADLSGSWLVKKTAKLVPTLKVGFEDIKHRD